MGNNDQCNNYSRCGGGTSHGDRFTSLLLRCWTDGRTVLTVLPAHKFPSSTIVGFIGFGPPKNQTYGDEGQITNREWYQAYCAAMLESDVNKVITSVESARKAIQKRAKELNMGRAGSNHESVELDRALRFLTMLVNCSMPTQVSTAYANYAN